MKPKPGKMRQSAKPVLPDVWLLSSGLASAQSVVDALAALKNDVIGKAPLTAPQLQVQGRRVGEGSSQLDTNAAALGAAYDLQPLVHFWGVPPMQPAALQQAIVRAGLKPSRLIYDRLKHYETIVSGDLD